MYECEWCVSEDDERRIDAKIAVNVNVLKVMWSGMKRKRVSASCLSVC